MFEPEETTETENIVKKDQIALIPEKHTALTNELRFRPLTA